jgi:hypothetical protein
MIWADLPIQSILRYHLCHGLVMLHVFLMLVGLSRILSNHLRTRTHLRRIRILTDSVCVCGGDYETLDHVIWHCSCFEENRIKLEREMASLEMPLNTSISDLLGMRSLPALGFYHKGGDSG